jgi:hypothetical protein
MKSSDETKFIRTQYNDTLQPARINKTTGEVTNVPKARLKEVVEACGSMAYIGDYGAEGDLLTYTPHWILHGRNRISKDIENKVDKSRKVRNNPLTVHLEGFMFIDDAVDCYSVIDDLITGVSMLSDGKENPMSKQLLFTLMRDLPVISTATVQEATGYSERHCQKLALYLRVLLTAAEGVILKADEEISENITL